MTTIALETETTTARAFRTRGDGSVEDLTFDTVPVAPPKRGEVLVAIKAVSLNYRDLGIIGGSAKPATVLGSDAAGEVVAVGEGVTRFAVGDRVAGSFFQQWIDGRLRKPYFQTTLGGGIDGVLTTARVFPEQGLVRVPDHLSYEEAATLPCAALTAWHALVTTAHVTRDDTVVILGTGGVSIFALQFAKLLGARTIVTSSSDEKLARARTLGADETINYRTTPEWQNEVLRLTGGEGADVVVEVGGAGTLPRSIEATRPGGQVSVVGFLTGANEPFNLRSLLPTIRLQGIYVGSVAMFEEMNAFIAKHQLRPVIDRVFAFDETREALRYLKSAQHLGKVVVNVAG